MYLYLTYGLFFQLSGGSDTPTPGGVDILSAGGMAGAPSNMMGGLPDIFGTPVKNGFVPPQEVSSILFMNFLALYMFFKLVYI